MRSLGLGFTVRYSVRAEREGDENGGQGCCVPLVLREFACGPGQGCNDEDKADDDVGPQHRLLVEGSALECKPKARKGGDAKDRSGESGEDGDGKDSEDEPAEEVGEHVGHVEDGGVGEGGDIGGVQQ
jgi:hypothetical protein